MKGRRFLMASGLYLCEHNQGDETGWIATSRDSTWTPDKKAVARGCKLAEKLGYVTSIAPNVIKITPLGRAMLNLVT